MRRLITFTAIASIGVFIVSFWMAGVARVSSDVLAIASYAISIMRDESLGDDIREKEIQRASIKMLSAFLSILFRSAFALFASFLTIWLADTAGLADTDDVIKFMSRWDVIGITTGIVIIAYLFFFRSKPDSGVGYRVNYSGSDRMLHRIAFCSPAVRITAVDIEETLFSSAYKEAPVKRPILYHLACQGRHHGFIGGSVQIPRYRNTHLS